MSTFTVKWEIDVEADTPEDAAYQALDIQRDPDSIATCFEVSNDSGVNVAVDIFEKDEVTDDDIYDKINIGVTNTPVKVLDFDDITTGPTVEQLENDYPEHSRIEAEGLADDEIAEMQNFRPSDMKNVRACPGELHDYQKEALDLVVRDGQSAILVLPTGAGQAISKAEMFQTKVRGSNDQEYQLYLDHADNGKGGDITNNNLPLKLYDEWLNS